MDNFHLVKSWEYFHVVKSLEYFHLVKSTRYFYLVESMEYFDLVESFEYFLAQTISSFKLRIFNIVSVCLYLAHSSLQNFYNKIPIRKPVGAICQPSSSGSGADDKLEFICCVFRRKPQIHEVWTLTEKIPRSLENAHATPRRGCDALSRSTVRRETKISWIPVT